MKRKATAVRPVLLEKSILREENTIAQNQMGEEGSQVTHRNKVHVPCLPGQPTVIHGDKAKVREGSQQAFLSTLCTKTTEKNKPGLPQAPHDMLGERLPSRELRPPRLHGTVTGTTESACCPRNGPSRTSEWV